MDFKADSPVQYGEIWLADLGMRYETELGKERPVLIIQTTFSIQLEESSLIIIPFTSQIEAEFSLIRIRFDQAENGLDKPSDVLINQIRAINRTRLQSKIGVATETQMRQVQTSLQLILGIDS